MGRLAAISVIDVSVVWKETGFGFSLIVIKILALFLTSSVNLGESLGFLSLGFQLPGAPRLGYLLLLNKPPPSAGASNSNSSVSLSLTGPGIDWAQPGRSYLSCRFWSQGG